VGKRVKGMDLAETGFSGYRRVEDAITLQAIEVAEEQVRAWLDEAAAAIGLAKAEREAAERKARGEFSLDDAVEEADGADG
jgi:hypothetical protein